MKLGDKKLNLNHLDFLRRAKDRACACKQEIEAESA